MKRVRHTLAACALAATLPSVPLASAAAARPAPPRTGTARQPAPRQQPQPSPTPTPSPQPQEQERGRRAGETQPPPLPPPSTPTRQPPAPAARPAQPPPAGVDDDEVLSVDTSLVNVVFNATDADRRFVTTLKREDVRVFEDGVPQEVTIFQRETELPLSIAFLVDVSGSQESTLPIEKDAARAFIKSILRPGKDTAAVVSFTGEAVVEQDMTRQLDSLYTAIESLRVILPPKDQLANAAGGPNTGVVTQTGGNAGTRPSVGTQPDAGAVAVPPPAELDPDSPVGWTSVWDAVWATSNELMSQTPSHTRRAIILLSDGDDTRSRLKREEAAEAAVKANTIVYSIGVEPYCEFSECKLDKKALRRISEATGGRAFFPEDETQLGAAFHQIQQELRTQYLAAYSPTNKARDGSFRRLRIEFATPELKKQKLKLAYREGYFALSPPSTAAARRERAPQDRLTRPPRRKKR